MLLRNKCVSGSATARVHIDGQPYINFFGANYLALAQVPEIRAAVAAELARGSAIGRQIPATMGAKEPAFDAIERAGAEALGTESSVYLASGYLTGAVALKVFEKPYDLLFMDEHAHYSLRDAARMDERTPHYFAHCDPQALREALDHWIKPGQRPIVLTDGVFATSGRVAPLGDYAAELSRFEGGLLVDEAHAFGVVGDHGRGAAELHAVEKLSVVGATLSKAYCAQGALVGCPSSALDRIRAETPIRGSNAGSPLSAAAATAAFTYMKAHPQIRVQLRVLADTLRGRLRQIGAEVVDTPAPIVSFRVGRRPDMEYLQQRAFNHGVHLHYSDYIGAGKEGCIRCAVFRDHTPQDFDVMLSLLS